MQTHRILRGALAGLYLPFGMSRLRAMRSVKGDGYFTQQYLLPGATVRVSQNPSYAVVEITANGDAYFEFQTSGFPVTIASGKYKAATVGVSISNGTLKADLLDHERVTNTGVTSPLHRSQQVQLLDEPVHYPGPKSQDVYPRALYQSWAPHNPHTGIHLRSYHCQMVPWFSNFDRGAITTHATRDVSYDVGYADGDAANAVRYAYLRGTADWPRATGIQTVVDNTHGTREFAIYVDAFDQVNVFPTAQITAFLGNDGFGDPIQNVTSTYVKKARVAFPAWVYAKTGKFSDFYAADPGNTGLTDFPEYEWKLHPDGTKMCAVVYERVAATFDSAFYGNSAYSHAWDGTSGFSGFRPDATSWDLLNTYIMGAYPQMGVFPEGGGDTRYTSATGLLEVGITIALTGPNPEDYTLTLPSPTEIRRPTTSAYCTLLAGYTWHDVMDPSSTPEIRVYQAHRGDLCVLDAECYGDNATANNASLLSLKNMTAGTELRTFGAEVEDTFVAHDDTIATGIVKVLAYDMQTLSFAMKHTHKVKTRPEDPISGDLGATCAIHFGVGIYVMNRAKAMLFPETQDPDISETIRTAAEADGRIAMDQLGAVTLMPVNDLRTWGDTDLDSLRESYDSATPAGGHGGFGSVSPDLIGNQYMITAGLKYERAARVTAIPTSAAANWYATMTQGRSYPFPMFNLTDPRPGWYQYMGELLTRIQCSPYTTFFAHPNGSWAFFNQEFIYNKAGQGFAASQLSGNHRRTCSVPLDPDNFEHCIFDKVHFEGKSTLESSFLALYNLAINRGIVASNLLDASAVVSYADMRATFSKDTVADGVDAGVVYDSLKISWQGYDARITDHAYYSGHKLTALGAFAVPNWDFPADGLLLSPSLGAYWTDLAATSFVVPQVEAQPVTFSSCVMISA